MCIINAFPHEMILRAFGLKTVEKPNI